MPFLQFGLEPEPKPEPNMQTVRAAEIAQKLDRLLQQIISYLIGEIPHNTAVLRRLQEDYLALQTERAQLGQQIA